MKCRKCTKDYSDDFEYCPYCGTKKPAKGSTPSVPLIYTFPVLSDAQLEQFSAEINGKCGGEIRSFILSADYPVNVFVIRGEWQEERDIGKRKAGNWSVKELIKTTPWIYEDGPYSNVRFFVEEKPFTKYMFNYIDRSVFRTNDAAISALNKAGYTRLVDGKWYSGEADG